MELTTMFVLLQLVFILYGLKGVIQLVIGPKEGDIVSWVEEILKEDEDTTSEQAETTLSNVEDMRHTINLATGRADDEILIALIRSFSLILGVLVIIIMLMPAITLAAGMDTLSLVVFIMTVLTAYKGVQGFNIKTFIKTMLPYLVFLILTVVNII